jgi:hypothetical protein
MAAFARIALALAALALLAGAAMHGMAFTKVDAAVAASNLPAFLGSSLRVFWLNDSANLLILAVIFVLCAIRPASASRALIVLLALMPAAIGVLLLHYLGPVFPTLFTLGVAILVFVAGLLWPTTQEQRT